MLKHRQPDLAQLTDLAPSHAPKFLLTRDRAKTLMDYMDLAGHLAKWQDCFEYIAEPFEGILHCG